MPHSIKSGITAAKTKNQPFQLIWKGAEIQLLVGSIKNEEIEEARKALDAQKKGLTEIKGKCSFDSEAKKIVFFSSSAPTAPTFPSKLKAIIGKAGITLDANNIILTKKQTDLLFADDDNDAAKNKQPQPKTEGTPTDQNQQKTDADKKPDPDAPKDEIPVAPPLPESKEKKPEPTDDKAAAIKRLNALNTKLQAALKANVEESEKLRELSIQVRKMLTNGEPGLLAVLEKLETLLAGIPEDKLTPTPKQPTPKDEAKKDAPKEETAKEKAPQEVKADVIKRLNALNASLQAALKSKSPRATEVKTLSLDARKLLTNSEFGQAAELVTKLEEVLAAMAAEQGSTVPPPPPKPETPEPTADTTTEEDEGEEDEEEPEPKQVSNVVFTKARLQWDTARKSVQTELKSLEKGIIDICQQINDNEESDDEIDIEELKGQVKLLYGIMENLDESLMDKLDEALNAKTPELRKARHKEASGIIKKYLQFVNGDPVMARIDSSGFVETQIRKTVTDVLKDLQSKL